MTIEDFRGELDPEVIPNEWLWERIRIWRDKELAATDWTQVADAPVNQNAWKAYREALRNLPTQSSDPHEITFPSKP